MTDAIYRNQKRIERLVASANFSIEKTGEKDTPYKAFFESFDVCCYGPTEKEALDSAKNELCILLQGDLKEEDRLKSIILRRKKN